MLIIITPNTLRPFWMFGSLWTLGNVFKGQKISFKFVASIFNIIQRVCTVNHLKNKQKKKTKAFMLHAFSLLPSSGLA